MLLTSVALWVSKSFCSSGFTLRTRHLISYLLNGNVIIVCEVILKSVSRQTQLNQKVHKPNSTNPEHFSASTMQVMSRTTQKKNILTLFTIFTCPSLSFFFGFLSSTSAKCAVGTSPRIWSVICTSIPYGPKVLTVPYVQRELRYKFQYFTQHLLY